MLGTNLCGPPPKYTPLKTHTALKQIVAEIVAETVAEIVKETSYVWSKILYV